MPTWFGPIYSIASIVAFIYLAITAPKPSGPQPAGFRGWLLFFGLGLAVISPLASMGAFTAEVHNAEREYPGIMSSDTQLAQFQALMWILMLAIAAWRWHVVWMLARRYEPVSLIWARISLPTSVIIELLCIGWLLAQLDLTGVYGEFVRDGIYSVLASFIWLIYLFVSKRVRNTYMISKDHGSDVRQPRAPLRFTEEAGSTSVSAMPVRTQHSDDEWHWPRSGSKRSTAERLKELRDLRNAGLITEEDYNAKKDDILSNV
jgi:hypothetical protein